MSQLTIRRFSVFFAVFFMPSMLAFFLKQRSCMRSLKRTDFFADRKASSRSPCCRDCDSRAHSSADISPSSHVVDSWPAHASDCMPQLDVSVEQAANGAEVIERNLPLT